MAFLEEKGLERLWAHTVNKINETVAEIDVQDEIYIGEGEMPEGYTLQINPAASAMRAASYAVYSTIIPTTGWTDTAPYSITIPVEGVLASDTPIGPDVVQTGDETVDEPMRKAWQKITRMTTADGSVTFYNSKEVPTVELPVQWVVIR